MAEAHGAVITGAGITCGLGNSAGEIAACLQQGRFAASRPFFAQEAAAMVTLGFNPDYVPLPGDARLETRRRESPGARMSRLLEDVIAAAIHEAGIEASVLGQRDVQVYAGAAAPHADVINCMAYLRRNDAVDLKVQPGIRELHSRQHSQEDFARALMSRYRLSRPPHCVFTASCSSMSALYLASQAIESKRISLALVLCWQEITLFDLLFLQGIGGLSRQLAQPFAENSDGVLPAACIGALVLQQPGRHCRGIHIAGFAAAQNAGSARMSTVFAPDFRNIAGVMSAALRKANVTTRQIRCIFAHGNGIRGCDNAESLAVRKVWAECCAPLVSYKSQIGYSLGSSALLDLALIADAFRRQRILAASSRVALNSPPGLHLHADCEPLKFDQGSIMKIALGMDGSILVAILARN